jgi:hypothetical protein
MSVDYQAQLSELLEKEKTLIKKMNVAMRAGANAAIIGQFQFMLEEIRIAQFELRALQSNGKTDDGFDGYLSIG